VSDPQGLARVSARRGGQAADMDDNELLALRTDERAALLLVGLRGDW